MSESVRAKGVSSRIDNESGRVDGVIECQVEGDGLAIAQVSVRIGKGADMIYIQVHGTEQADG